MALTCKSELLALQLDEVQAAWALERTLLQTMAGRHEGVTAEAKSEVERLKGELAWAKKKVYPGQLSPDEATLGKLVTEKPVDFVGFDNVVKAYKS